MNDDGDVPLDPTLDILHPDVESETFDLSVDLPDYSDLLVPQTNVEDTWYGPLDLPPLASYSSPSTRQAQNGRNPTTPPTMTIQRSPTYNLRSFNYRTRLNTGAQRIAKLIFHTLKSYPIMISRDKRLPPFIHPYLVTEDAENSDMEPLTNCINLMHMLSSRFNGSRKLFWKNVRMECEILYANV